MKNRPPATGKTVFAVNKQSFTVWLYGGFLYKQSKVVYIIMVALRCNKVPREYKVARLLAMLIQPMDEMLLVMIPSFVVGGWALFNKFIRIYQLAQEN